MSTRLILWLNAPDAGWLDPADTPLALGTLLVMAARDNRDTIRDLSVVDAALARRHDLTPKEAIEMRRICETVADTAPPCGVLSDLICTHVPDRERLALLRCLSEETGDTLARGVTSADLLQLLGLATGSHSKTALH